MTSFLPYAERPVRGLVLHRRVPPAVEVHHMVGSGEVQSDPSRLQGQHHIRDVVVLGVEPLHHLRPLLGGRAAVQHKTFASEDLLQEVGERSGELPVLGEHQDPLAVVADGLAYLTELDELAAGLLVVVSFAHVQVRVVAYLLELGYGGQPMPGPTGSRRTATVQSCVQDTADCTDSGRGTVTRAGHTEHLCW